MEQRRAEWSCRPGWNRLGTGSQRLTAVLDPESRPEHEEGRQRPHRLHVAADRWSTHSRPPDRRPALWDRIKLHKHGHVFSLLLDF